MEGIKTRHGPMFAMPGDRYITRSLMLYGEYCPDEWDLMAQIVKPGMAVVEIGANIGAHSIPLAKACAPGPIYLFEPQQRIFQVLCANIVLNDIKNAIVFPDACGATETLGAMPVIDYETADNFGGFSVFPYNGRGVRVRVISLDSLHLKTCGFLKIDVEGSELSVLEGANRTIENNRPVIYIENDRKDLKNNIIHKIKSLGYRMYWHKPGLFSKRNFNGNSENVFGKVGSVNMLCIPGERATVVQGLVPVEVEISS